MPLQSFLDPETLLMALTNPEQAAIHLASQGVQLGDADAMALAQISGGQGQGPVQPGTLPQAPGQIPGGGTGVPPAFQTLGALAGGQQAGAPVGPTAGINAAVQPPSPQPEAPPQPDQGQQLGQILAAVQQGTQGPPPPQPTAPRPGSYSAPNNLLPLLQLATQAGGQQQNPQIANPLGQLIAGLF